MMSPKMLKSKIHISTGGWGGGVDCQLLMPSPNLLKSKKKFTRGLAENFLSFRAKKCLGMVLDFEYYTRTTIIAYDRKQKNIPYFHHREKRV